MTLLSLSAFLTGRDKDHPAFISPQMTGWSKPGNRSGGGEPRGAVSPVMPSRTEPGVAWLGMMAAGVIVLRRRRSVKGTLPSL